MLLYSFFLHLFFATFNGATHIPRPPGVQKHPPQNFFFFSFSFSFSSFFFFPRARYISDMDNLFKLTLCHNSSYAHEIWAKTIFLTLTSFQGHDIFKVIFANNSIIAQYFLMQMPLMNSLCP